jgi:hypothetical protein
MLGTFIEKTCQSLTVAATCRPEEVVIHARKAGQAASNSGRR